MRASTPARSSALIRSAAAANTPARRSRIASSWYCSASAAAEAEDSAVSQDSS
jgi:hypothetical protein